MESNRRKVYTDANGYVIFSCPNCGKMQKEQAQKYKNHKGPIKIQCKCGDFYEVEIEFRKLFRKETRLDGVFTASSKPGNWEKIIVKDLSMKGCKFETLKAIFLNPDEEIKIEFRLNNTKNSLIRKKAIIRHVDKNYAGCEFQDQTGDLDPDLGFYLRSL
ncbi:MAG: PilZ domain-containing protein [Smithella sp.]